MKRRPGRLQHGVRFDKTKGYMVDKRAYRVPQGFWDAHIPNTVHDAGILAHIQSADFDSVPTTSFSDHDFGDTPSHIRDEVAALIDDGNGQVDGSYKEAKSEVLTMRPKCMTKCMSASYNPAPHHHTLPFLYRDPHTGTETMRCPTVICR